jgi:hypothetical protein
MTHDRTRSSGLVVAATVSHDGRQNAADIYYFSRFRFDSRGVSLITVAGKKDQA